ncbi:unnamed protein product [Dicrocoelium dendriticum]|nr:unnamed protein product [Dicrocoelium dendriticum]
MHMPTWNVQLKLKKVYVKSLKSLQELPYGEKRKDLLAVLCDANVTLANVRIGMLKTFVQVLFLFEKPI